MFTIINDRACEKLVIEKKKHGGIKVTGTDILTNVLHTQDFKNEKELKPKGLYTQDYDLSDINDLGEIEISEEPIHCECFKDWYIGCECDNDTRYIQLHNIQFRSIELRDNIIYMFHKKDRTKNIIITTVHWNDQQIVTSFKVVYPN